MCSANHFFGPCTIKLETEPRNFTSDSHFITFPSCFLSLSGEAWQWQRRMVIGPVNILPRKDATSGEARALRGQRRWRAACELEEAEAGAPRTHFILNIWLFGSSLDASPRTRTGESGGNNSQRPLSPSPSHLRAECSLRLVGRELR